jgi:uncharacterized membrane protein
VEQAKEQVRIEAPVQRCFDTLVDFEAYPDWAGDLKQVAVVERDAGGRPTVVEFRAAAMGRSTTYQLGYDYTGAPNRLAWQLVSGDLPRELDGAYELVEAADDPSATEVSYEISVDLIVPIPGFVKRRAEAKILKTALIELKARVEGAPRPDLDDVDDD